MNVREDAGCRVRFPPTSCILRPVSCILHPAAFSLIELIISLSILAGGLFAAMQVFPGGLRASKRSEMSSRATIVAQRTIESLKLKPWAELVENETTTEEERFEVRTQITQPSLEGVVDPTRLKAVEVSVHWIQDGRPRTVSFVTYLRQPTS